MRKKTLGILLVGALALAAPSSGQENNGTLQLSLEECIVKALRDNLGVAIQVLGPEISGEGVSRAQEKYIPSLSLSVNSRNTENATFSYLDAQQDSTVDKTQNFTFLSASQALPTGGTLNLDFTGYKTSTNRTGQTINPRYGTTLRFNFSQPLLRNFGFKMSRREIVVAVNNLGISEEQLRRTLTDTVYNVESAYWNLVYSLENLEVRRQSLALAQDLLEKNQRSVEVGTMAPMDVLSARAEVATREADIIQAEMEVETRGDQLKALLNLPTDGDQAVDILLPKDKPTFEEKSFDLDEALALAVQNRTDLAIAKIGIKNDELDLSYAKNQTLPDLNLSASFSSPGIDGTTILYDGNPITRECHRDHPRRDQRGHQADDPVQVPQLERRPDAQSALGQRLLESLSGPGQAQYETGHAGPRVSEAAGLPRDQERRPVRRRQPQADPGLHDGQGAGRAEAGRRGREAAGRAEHELLGPAPSARPGLGPHLRAQRHHRLQRLVGVARAVDGHEPEEPERHARGLLVGAELSRPGRPPIRGLNSGGVRV
jgi:outer membrane protein TolC